MPNMEEAHGEPRTIHSDLIIRDAVKEDLPALLELYNDAIINTAATLDIHPQTLEQRTEWFEEHQGKYSLVVAEFRGKVVGYATLSKFRGHPAFLKSVENSVYIDKNNQGLGIGTALMKRIIEKARESGFHTIIAVIVPPNQGSIRLHEKLGFRLVGTLKEVRFKYGTWQDTMWYQLLLE